MEIIDMILDEITSVLAKVDEIKLMEIVDSIQREKKIFIDGEGRSGLMAKGFAMRLMHLGFIVYSVGETITPAVNPGDIYISISGSGESGNVVLNTKKAKEAGCFIIGISSKETSSLASLSDKLLIVPGTTKGDNGEQRKSIQLLSSLFDQSLHIVLDTLCLMLSRKENISNEKATAKHW